MPAPPTLKRTCRLQKSFTPFQCFLSQVLSEERKEPGQDLDLCSYSGLFLKVKDECHRLINSGLKDLESDFLEARYYGCNSEILKRLRYELQAKVGAESVIHEPSLCHRPSRGSLLSEAFEPDEPMLGKHKFRLPSLDFEDVPVLTKMSSGNKGSKRSTSIILDFVVIIQEINAVYLQTVNVIIDAQKSNIGKLAVYNMLVPLVITLVGEIPPINT